MKAFVGLVAVLLIAVVAVGFHQGWFQLNKTKDEEGKTHVDLTIDKDKMLKDKKELLGHVHSKSDVLKAHIAKLREKLKSSKGEEKTMTEKEIEKSESLSQRLKDAESASEEKLNELNVGMPR